MSEREGLVTLKGNPVTLEGEGVKVGDKAPAFTATATDMSAKTLADYNDKAIILAVVPSLDTPVCDAQTKRFNEEAGKLGNVAVVTISMDLPMAQKRWCGANNATHVVTLSDFKDHSFAKAFGLRIKELGLLARAIYVIDKNGVIQYEELVPEVAQEPNYDAALAAAKQLA
jgi:thiol peroxidase